MNRELLCPTCAEKSKKELTGDKFKFVAGKIKVNHLACDKCEKDFKKGDLAEAFSTWTGTGKNDYTTWEKIYLIYD